MKKYEAMLWRTCIVVAMMWFISACAYTVVDSDGTKHIIGLVSIKIPAAEQKKSFVGDSVSVTSIGLSIYSTPLNSGFAFGYNRESITALRQNAAILSDDFCLKPMNLGNDVSLSSSKFPRQEVHP